MGGTRRSQIVHRPQATPCQDPECAKRTSKSRRMLGWQAAISHPRPPARFKIFWVRKEDGIRHRTARRIANKGLKECKVSIANEKATTTIHEDYERLSVTPRLLLSINTGYFRAIAQPPEDNVELHTSTRPTSASDDYNRSIPTSRVSSAIEQPFEADRV